MTGKTDITANDVDQLRSPVGRSLRQGRKSEKLFTLLPRGLSQVLTSGAAMHGRTLSDEIRVALEIHALRSVLAALPDQQIQEQLGDTAAKYEQDLKSDLDAIQARAYARPTPEGFLVPYRPEQVDRA